MSSVATPLPANTTEFLPATDVVASSRGVSEGNSSTGRKFFYIYFFNFFQFFKLFFV